MQRATNNDMIHLHCHTDGSNLRLKDSNIKVNELIDYAYMLGNNGVAITDHECLSEHISAINYVNELKNDNKITQDFKLILGNEIYLMNKSDLKQKLEDKDKIKFYHCLLLAKDKIGHQQLRQLSSRAWRDNYINYKGMARVPTYYSDIEDIIGENKGHVIMLTACLGSYLGEQSVLLSQTNDEDEIYNIKMNMSDYIEWAMDVFGNDLYLEMQPNKSEEQVFYNKLLVDISKGYDIPLVVTTDVHYLDETTREMHKAFLTSDDEDSNREVDYFYDTTHFFKVEDIYNNMDYLDEDIVTKAILTTKDIANKIESYDWFASPKIPLIPLPPKQEWFPIDLDLIKQYPNIEGVYKDNYEHHTYLIHQIFKGIEEHNIPKEELNDTLSRVDLECSEIIGTSEVLNEPVGAYLVTMQKNVDLIWEVSCVGAGRGSAVGWVIDYLLGITQINPIKQDGMKLQHWRFLNSERVTFPDLCFILKIKYNKSNLLEIVGVKSLELLESPKAFLTTT